MDEEQGEEDMLDEMGDDAEVEEPSDDEVINFNESQ